MGDEKLTVSVDNNVYKVTKERDSLDKNEVDNQRNSLCRDRARFLEVITNLETSINKYNTALGYDEDDFDVK